MFMSRIIQRTQHIFISTMQRLPLCFFKSPSPTKQPWSYGKRLRARSSASMDFARYFSAYASRAAHSCGECHVCQEFSDILRQAGDQTTREAVLFLLNNTQSPNAHIFREKLEIELVQAQRRIAQGRTIERIRARQQVKVLRGVLDFYRDYLESEDPPPEYPGLPPSHPPIYDHSQQEWRLDERETQPFDSEEHLKDQWTQLWSYCAEAEARFNDRMRMVEEIESSLGRRRAYLDERNEMADERDKELDTWSRELDARSVQLDAQSVDLVTQRKNLPDE